MTKILLMPHIIRGCGERKTGGIYLFADAGIAINCLRLPMKLPEACPCCGEKIRRLRSFRVINPQKFWSNCKGTIADHLCHEIACKVCFPPEKAGVSWIGKKFYETPKDFIEEAFTHGMSRRVNYMPEDLHVGDWLYLVHPEAFPEGKVRDDRAGVVFATKLTAVHKIISQEQAKDSKLLAEIEKVGMTPVIDVPGLLAPIIVEGPLSGGLPKGDLPKSQSTLTPFIEDQQKATDKAELDLKVLSVSVEQERLQKEVAVIPCEVCSNLVPEDKLRLSPEGEKICCECYEALNDPEIVDDGDDCDGIH